MKKVFCEIDPSGIVVDVVIDEYDEHDKPKKHKAKNGNTLKVNGNVNKGDRWSDKHQRFERRLIKR